MGKQTSHRGGMIGRRDFLIGSALAGVAVGAGARLGRAAAGEKLHIGIIGAGGRGRANTQAVAEGNNIVALCDVSAKALAEAGEKYPGARQYRDYRKMLEAKRDLDAVVISTPDHSHALSALMALDLDLHVYCEKALTHSLWEARLVREAAEAKPRLATQMGIQIQAGANYRRVVELIQSGAIGEVREAHVWTIRVKGGGRRPEPPEPVPEHLDWDLWLGGAPERPFHSDYLGRPGWYQFWDFGGGTLTDMGSHWNDLPFWALQLDAPRRIEASGPPPHPETAPAELAVRFDFDARGDLPPATLHWSHGRSYPVRYEGPALPEGWNNGILFVGSKGMVLADYSRHVLLPEEQFAGFERPEPWLEQSPGQQAEWVRACKGGPKPLANFEYSGRLTEMNHLGNIAHRTGEKLAWDFEAMRTDVPAANGLLRRTYRPGWEIAS